MKTLNVLLIALLASVPALSQQEDDSQLGQSLDSLLNMKVQTASKYWQKASESPTSVTIVTASDIENQGYRTLDEVLNAVRSFYTSYDRNYSYVGVRGFGRPTDYNDRILLLLNGHTINEHFYGSAPLGTDFGIDLRSVDRIEIVRGPGSALYGSGAMFGVINIITKTGRSADVARVEGDFGSNGRREASVMLGKEHHTGLNVLLSSNWRDVKGQDLYFQEFDTDSTNHGVARNLDWMKEWSILGTIGYGDFSFQAVIVNSRKGVPTASFGTIFNDPDCWTLDRTSLVELKYQRDLSPSLALMVRGYYDNYHYEGAYPYEVQTHDGTNSDKVGSEIQFRWDSSPKNRLVSGIESFRVYRSSYIYGTFSDIYYDRDFPYSSISGYAQDEWQIAEKVALVTGFRVDAYSHISPTLNPRAAVIVSPSNSTTLKLLLGQAFRAPNNYELFYEDQTTVPAMKANPELHAERIVTSEIVCDQRISSTVSTSFSVYNNVISGLIDQQLDPVDSSYQFQNISKVDAYGIEGELTARLKQGIVLGASATYGQAKVVSSGAAWTIFSSGVPLTNSPSTVLKANVSVPLAEFIRIGSTMRYESGRKTVYDTWTDAYFTMDLLLSAKVQALDGDLPGAPTLTLRISNLLNKLYAYPGGIEHVEPVIVQDGRNVLLSLALTF